MERVATVEPVTLAGWYECKNGQVAEYGWANGRLVEVRRVESWVYVPTRDARIHDGASY